MDYTVKDVVIEQDKAPNRIDMFTSYQKSVNDKLEQKKEGKENA